MYFLCGLVHQGMVVYSDLIFLTDEIWHRQTFSRYAQIDPQYISCVGVNSHFQNKHYSETDYTLKRDDGVCPVTGSLICLLTSEFLV